MTVAELCGTLQAWAHEGHAQDVVLVEPEDGVALHDVAGVVPHDGRFSGVIIRAGAAGGWSV